MEEIIEEIIENTPIPDLVEDFVSASDSELLTQISGQLEQLIYSQELIYTVLLFIVGCAAGVIVCYILYSFLRKFI